VIAAAITEPDVGSDTAGIKTSAVLDGDYYIINGTKEWISNGSICDVCNVLVQTDKTKGPLGIRMILVEKEISPFRTRDLPKLGLHAFPTSELGFEDCRVPRENMSDLSAEVAYSTLMKGFDIARPMWALHATGISQAAIDASINYAKERFQFGRPIGKFQLIQNMIYEMITETEAGQLLGYRALDLADKGERCRKEASMAKAYATEAAVRVTSMAIEIHGAMGLSQDLALERYFRDARTWTIPDGTTEIQKLIVAGEVLGIRAYV
jgi:alkylation response protein AidB-like acyl-CoA dehydrogenase